MYGTVTECQEIPGIAAVVAVADGKLFVEKIIATPEAGDTAFEAARVRVLERLRDLGCSAINPEETFSRHLWRHKLERDMHEEFDVSRIIASG